MSFSHLGLSDAIVRAVTETGYTTPTPIQTQAIPAVMNGGDLLAGAQTGTGKTAGFTLPVLHRLSTDAVGAKQTNNTSPRAIRALILTPTRELAAQVEESVRIYGKYTKLNSAVIFGGVSINPQIKLLKHGVDILVATPGRLLDHIEQKTVSLSQVQMLVMDEADRMLDMGFLPDLQRIINLLPKKRQNLMFSATFSPEIKKLANSFLTDPVTIEVARSNATADKVTQVVYKVAEEHKREAVAHILRSRELKQVIVFSNTKIGASRLARGLEQEGMKASAIHGDKTQQERMAALEAFKRGEIDVLVATDVAARGLDISDLPCVINYDLPYNAEDYVHRIGRTGRAGASGDAISIYSDKDERLLVDIEKLIKQAIRKADLAGFNPGAVRSDERGERRPPRRGAEGERSERPERPERAARPTDRAERTERTSNGSRPAGGPRRDKVDPWFLKPYEPTRATTSTAAASTTGASAKPKQKLAALLGGLPKE